MSSSDRTPLVERILDAADRLFYQQGIRAVGVDAIAAAAQVSKRTLYNHFRSKDELIAAYLARRAQPMPLSDAPPAVQILAVFDRLERGFAARGFRGCPFVNAVVELGHAVPVANAMAVDFKEQRRQWYRELLGRLGVADADALASQIVLLVDGAIAHMLVRGDPKVARSAQDAVRTLLEAAGVQCPHPGADNGSSRPARGRPRA